MLAMAGHEVTLLGRPGSKTIMKPLIGGFDISCIELDEIKGTSLTTETGYSESKKIPDSGLTKEDFIKRFNLITPIQTRVEELLKKHSDLAKLGDKDLIPKVTLLSILNTAVHINASTTPSPGKICLSTSTNLSPQDYVVVAVKGDVINEEMAKRVNAIKGNPQIIVAANGIMPWIKKLDKIPPSLARIQRFSDIVNPKRIVGMVLRCAVVLEEKRNSTTLRIKSKAFNLIGTSIGSIANTDLSVIEKTYKDAGIPCLAEEGGIASAMIKKLAINMSNGATAIFGTTCKEATDDLLQKNIMIAAIKEIHSVAQSNGIVLQDKDGLIPQEKFASTTIAALSNAGAHITSTLADINAGRETEKDFLFKAIAEMGNNSGLATPVLNKIYDVLSLVEQQSIEDHNPKNSRPGFKKNGVSAQRGNIRECIKGDDIAAFLNADFSSLSVVKGELKPINNTKTLAKL